ncbi:MAG: hypothetical protein JW727_03920 [Candidatus Aenigmarchaeota archaeon]|nr:hypothetical protein [Candidatus Aenigmarchaeota archaeon]
MVEKYSYLQGETIAGSSYSERAYSWIKENKWPIIGGVIVAGALLALAGTGIDNPYDPGDLGFYEQTNFSGTGTVDTSGTWEYPFQMGPESWHTPQEGHISPNIHGAYIPSPNGPPTFWQGPSSAPTAAPELPEWMKGQGLGHFRISFS